MLFKKEFPSKTKEPQFTGVDGDITSLLYSICDFDFVVTIVVIVQMCLAFNKSLQERSLDIKAEPRSLDIKAEP
jgi:hypothetical protein